MDVHRDFKELLALLNAVSRKGDLDIDLELDCLANPQTYPLKYKP